MDIILVYRNKTSTSNTNNSVYYIKFNITVRGKLTSYSYHLGKGVLNVH